jgi:hypothetical protein
VSTTVPGTPAILSGIRKRRLDADKFLPEPDAAQNEVRIEPNVGFTDRRTLPHLAIAIDVAARTASVWICKSLKLLGNLKPTSLRMPEILQNPC